MTEFLIRTVARHPLRRLARPSAVLAFTLALAYGGGFWETLLHHVEGGHERNEPLAGRALAARRDARAAARVLRRLGRGPRRPAAASSATGAERSPVTSRRGPRGDRCVASTALRRRARAARCTTRSSGARHGGPRRSTVVHVGCATRCSRWRSTCRSPALVSAALLRTRPWATPLVRRLAPPVPARAGAAPSRARSRCVVIAPVALVAQNGARARRPPARARARRARPGAPLKTFDVQAIDVDIPLNRFGDHDPRRARCTSSSSAGRRRPRARSSSRNVSIGQKANDPIQPLVIRANQGDCVQINFTNDASGGDYGVHIDGLAYDVDVLGRRRRRQRLVAPSATARRAPTATGCPATRSSRARTTCVPAPATGRRLRTGCSAR